MAAVITYKRLALEWQPAHNNSTTFHRITVAVLLVIVALAMLLSSIPVPEKERRERVVVPEHIAKFIAQRKLPPVPEPVTPPKVEPRPIPLPRVEPKPTVERTRPSEIERKPLTESAQKARETAVQSGLLALSNELSDLIDTSDVSAQMAGSLATNSAGETAMAGHDARIITAGVAEGGGGVDSARFTGSVGGTQLTAREIASVRSGLLDQDNSNETIKSRNTRSGNGRAEEDVTIVFDRNKGSLYSLYERERRKTPGLQGKIVLQITIAPNGEVTDVKIISSELNNPALESRLIGRIKLFKFEANNVDPVTVTYPIEFLPS